MKPSHMELGGHAPVIVCADTDPVKAAKTAVRAKDRQRRAGVHLAAEPVPLVDRRVYDAFYTRRSCVEVMAAIKVGNGLQPSVQMGPMVSHPSAGQPGAEAHRGPRRRSAPARPSPPTASRSRSKGFFHQPTSKLTDVPAKRGDPARGAVRPGRPGRRVRDDLDEAIEVANARCPTAWRPTATPDSARPRRRSSSPGTRRASSVHPTTAAARYPRLPLRQLQGERLRPEEGGPEGLEGFPGYASACVAQAQALDFPCSANSSQVWGGSPPPGGSGSQR